MANKPTIKIMGVFKIVTLNCSRISNGGKLLDIIGRFDREDINIFCLQEIDVDSVVKFFNDK